MTLFLICLALALVVGLLVIYVRLSPLRAFANERRALQEARMGKAGTIVTEKADLFNGLRSLITELVGTVHLERSIANERCDQIQAERAISEALRAQLSAERFASEALCAQHNTARLALEKLCLELHAEHVDLQDALYCAFGPARVNHAVATIKARRAHAEQARAREEETKPQGISTHRAAPERQSSAGAELKRSRVEIPAALARDEPSERERATALPTTRKDIEEQCAPPAAAAVGDVDDATATQALSKVTLATALEVEEGGATLSPRGVPHAVHSGIVAPPASAPTPSASELSLKTAGLGERPQSLHGARPSARPTTTKTLMGIPAIRPPPPTDDSLPEHSSPPTRKQGSADHSGFVATTMCVAPASSSSTSTLSFLGEEADEEHERKRDNEVGAPPRAPRPSNEDGDATEVLDIDQEALQRALGVPAPERLSGAESVPEEAAKRLHSTDEEAPRKSRMTVLEAGK